MCGGARARDFLLQIAMQTFMIINFKVSFKYFKVILDYDTLNFSYTARKMSIHINFKVPALECFHYFHLFICLFVYFEKMQPYLRRAEGALLVVQRHK